MLEGPEKRTAGNALLALGWLLLLAAWAVRAFAKSSAGPLGLVYFCPGLAFGPIALMLLALHLRRKQVSLGILALLLVLGPLMGLALSTPAKPDASLRVATANIDCWTADPKLVGAHLARLDADILFLQEVWSFQSLAAMKQALPAYTFYPEGSTEEHSLTGLFVATRLPSKLLSLQALQAASVVYLEQAGQPLTLVSYHGQKRHQGYEAYLGLGETLTLQDKQLAELQKVLEQSPTALVGGDFNAPPSAPATRAMATAMRDVFAEAGLGYGYTFPPDYPILRIDYLFSGQGWRPLRCWTAFTGADHLAVVADLSRDPIPAKP